LPFLVSRFGIDLAVDAYLAAHEIAHAPGSADALPLK
jgi:hypothetical protein